jgi:hypothetical protein
MTDRERFDKAWETYAACNTNREPKHIAWWFFERGLEQGDHKMGERDAHIAELEAALSKALPHMDEGVQMMFDMDRHGITKPSQSTNDEALEFDRIAASVGFQSKYHPRMEEQHDAE